MKKLFFVMAVFLLTVSIPTTVLAQPFQIPESYDFSIEISLESNATSSEYQEYLNLLLALFGDPTIKAQGTIIQDTETFRAGHLYMEVELYSGLSYIPFTLWMDYDFTDPEDIVYKTIVELPKALWALMALADPGFARPYWVLDFSVLFTEFPEMTDLLVIMDETGLMDALDYNDIAALLPETESLGDNNYRLVITDEDLKGILVMFIEASVDDMHKSFANGFADAFIPDTDAEMFEALISETIEEIYASIGMLSEILQNVIIIPEDWVTYFTVDENGYPVQVDSRAQFIFDVQDWIIAVANTDPYFAVRVAAGEIDVPDIVITVDLNFPVHSKISIPPKDQHHLYLLRKTVWMFLT